MTNWAGAIRFSYSAPPGSAGNLILIYYKHVTPFESKNLIINTVILLHVRPQRGLMFAVVKLHR